MTLDTRIFRRRCASAREFLAAKNASLERGALKIAGLQCKYIGQLSIGECPDGESTTPINVVIIKIATTSMVNYSFIAQMCDMAGPANFFAKDAGDVR